MGQKGWKKDKNGKKWNLNEQKKGEKGQKKGKTGQKKDGKGRKRDKKGQKTLWKWLETPWKSCKNGGKPPEIGKFRVQGEKFPHFQPQTLGFEGRVLDFRPNPGFFFQPSAGIWGILDPSRFWVLFLHFQPHFHPFYPQFSPRLCRSPQTFCFFPPNRGIPRKFCLLRSQNRGFLPKKPPQIPFIPLFFRVQTPFPFSRLIFWVRTRHFHHFPWNCCFFPSCFP